MTKVKLTGLLTALLLALAAALPLRAAEEPAERSSEPAAHAYAVLIGISHYADPQIKPRPHAEADAKALYDLFRNKDYLGIEPDNIRLLLGSADPERKSEPASHENILKALHWLAARAGRDDLVLLAYFGEGAPLGSSGERLCYLAADSTLKDRARNAVTAGEIQQQLDKLKSQRFCAFLDVNFAGFQSGPEKVPEPVLGANPYREFRGSAGKEDQRSAPGRVLFLATDGLSPSLDLARHGLFTKVVLEGLKGAADTAGYEPDGVVTVEELEAYLAKQLPEQAQKFGKTEPEKQQQEVVLGSRSAHFVLTRNPAVSTKVAERLKKLNELAAAKKLNPQLAAEGRKLLARMPKLKAQQELRREYQRLVDGKLSPEAFRRQRDEILAATQMKRPAALVYAAKVIQATQVIREQYVKEVSQGNLVDWAIRGLYRYSDEHIPADIRERLDKIKDLSEAELTDLLAEVRERLGQREDLDHHKDLDVSLQRMLAHLDPYTTYIDPETLARFQQDTTGKFKGIGIQIRQNRKGMLEVVTPLKGSPAYRAGFKAGDVITKITRVVDSEGKELPEPEVISTKGMTINEAVKKIQGKPDTPIKLTVEREGVDHPIDIEVRRAEIQIESVLGYKRKANDEWDFYLDRPNKIAYIRLTSFARNTARDLKRAMDRLKAQGINGLVLDLRFNPGGLLTSAVEICDLFIDDGAIVTIRPRVGKEATYYAEQHSRDRSLLDFPMVCLVNHMSASGSEIVAACLQDHERALVMGERSYGKGSVQNIQPFEKGELKMTTASFWRPSGKNLNKSTTHGREDEDWGVRPNKGYTLPLSEKERDQLYERQRDLEIIPRHDLASREKKPEFKDRQLEMALDYLRAEIKKENKLTTKKAG